MRAETPILPFVALALAVANLWVSVAVIRSPFYSPRQKGVQCLMVWFIPLIGVIGVGLFLRAQYGWEKHDARIHHPADAGDTIPWDGHHANHDSFDGGGDGGGGD